MYPMDIVIAAFTVYCVFMVVIYILAFKRHTMVQLVPPILLSASLSVLGAYYLWLTISGGSVGGVTGQFLTALLLLSPLLSSYHLLLGILGRIHGRAGGEP